MSNEAKHTPGPWSVTGNEIRKSDGVPMLLATVNNSEGASINGYSAEANARLMAAAPDMLSVLKEAVDHAHVYDTNPALIQLFEAIIRKATQA